MYAKNYLAALVLFSHLNPYITTFSLLENLQWVSRVNPEQKKLKLQEKLDIEKNKGARSNVSSTETNEPKKDWAARGRVPKSEVRNTVFGHEWS